MAAEAGDFAKLMFDLLGNDACGSSCVFFSSVEGARGSKTKISKHMPSGMSFSHYTWRRKKKEQENKISIGDLI